MNRIITCWSAEAHSGRRTVIQQLAAHWASVEQSVFILEIGDGKESIAAFPEVSSWLQKSSVGNPAMVRNALADEHGLAHRRLRSYPDGETLPKMMAALRSAFQWTFILTPVDYSEAAILALEESDLLLWIAQPSMESTHRFKQGNEKLSGRHFAHAFSQVVINRASPSVKKTGFSIEPGKMPLAIIAEDPGTGLLLRQGVRVVAAALESKTQLFRATDHDANVPLDDHAIDQLRSRVQPELLRALGAPSEAGQVADATIAQKTVESCLADDALVAGSRRDREQIYTRVLEEVLGLGPIEPLLKDDSVSEIMVNGKGCVYIERRGKLETTTVVFSSENQLRTVIDRIVAPIGRRVDESMPLCDARLADGSRVNIVLPPLALDGPTLTIRKFRKQAIGIDELVRLGSLNPAMAELLRDCVISRRNIVVSGGTGSGKTTLLNALSSLIPDDERIVTIEDAAELRLQKPHVVRLESRPENAEGQGAIAIRRLVINALRMRPDRIVVGECRGGEALDMLQAMNTGHDGSLTTVHANSPRDALGRLETLALMAGMDLPVRVVREQIRSAVHIIVQQARLPDGSRKVISITEITGMEGDLLLTQELYRFHRQQFVATGIVPRFKELDREKAS